jgi:hypothetical protein
MAQLVKAKPATFTTNAASCTVKGNSDQPNRMSNPATKGTMIHPINTAELAINLSQPFVPTPTRERSAINSGFTRNIKAPLMHTPTT